MLARLARQHLLGALRAPIFHRRREVITDRRDPQIYSKELHKLCTPHFHIFRLKRGVTRGVNRRDPQIY